MIGDDILPQNPAFVDYKLSQQAFFLRYVENQNNIDADTIQSYCAKIKCVFDTEEGYFFLEANFDAIHLEYDLLCSVFESREEKQAQQFAQIKNPDPQSKNSIRISKDIYDEEAKSLAVQRFLIIHYAILLSIYASHYHGPNSHQVKNYQAKIDALTTPSKEPQAWHNQFINELSGVVETPFHTTTIRTTLGVMNIYRIHSVMSRMTWKSIFAYGEQTHWLQSFESALGLHVHPGVLDAPIAVTNALSVGLFSSRFLLNFGLLIKHSFEDGEFSYARCVREAKKRHWVMINDLVWAMVNLLTNYATYFKIAASTAGALLAGFLVFDFLWLIYLWNLNAMDYAKKKTQYEFEKNNVNLTIEVRNQIDEQLKILELKYIETQAGIAFAMTAAVLLVMSLSAAVFFASPALIPALGFFLCTVATGMYLSMGNFGTYWQKGVIYTRSGEEKDKTVLNEARWNFVCALTKNTFIPFFIVGLCTVSLPAAMACLVLYISYEYTFNYKKQEQATPLSSMSTGLFAQKKEQAMTDIDRQVDDIKKIIPQPT